jgi:hypothetical protein
MLGLEIYDVLVRKWVMILETLCASPFQWIKGLIFGFRLTQGKRGSHRTVPYLHLYQWSQGYP